MLGFCSFLVCRNFAIKFVHEVEDFVVCGRVGLDLVSLVDWFMTLTLVDWFMTLALVDWLTLAFVVANGFFVCEFQVRDLEVSNVVVLDLGLGLNS